ncbi:ribonuclease H-like domain-containing protein, partial [Tanacetum coccineum]
MEKTPGISTEIRLFLGIGELLPGDFIEIHLQDRRRAPHPVRADAAGNGDGRMRQMDIKEAEEKLYHLTTLELGAVTVDVDFRVTLMASSSGSIGPKLHMSMAYHLETDGPKVTEALSHAGIESSDLSVGIDFTKTNEWTGNFLSMLASYSYGFNPYEQALSIIWKTLAEFDEDNLIPCYGFGDATTHGQHVFGFYPEDISCNGFEDVMIRCRENVPQLTLAGQTSFTPRIEQAMTIIGKQASFIIVLVGDGTYNNPQFSSITTTNGDLEDEATPSGEQSSPLVPKTAKQLAARRNQERIKSILLLAIPDEYLLKFHNVPDANSLWAAIKSRFGGNEESKKMQKNVLKHLFENFVTASNETLDKAYDRFKKLISQLEIHGAYVSNEDINQKFLRTLVAQDSLGGYDWSNDFEIEPVNYALMAISSSNSSSSSDSEVQQCSKQCLESFKYLQKNYDIEREKHNKDKLEIRGYEIALESLESRILVHEKNELAWGEKYEFQNYDLKCREIKINNINLELEKVVKQRDELKLKIEKWEGSSKNLTKILNSQMSTHDKNGLGFGTQMDDLSNKSETDSENSLTVFEVRSSDEESTLANNRFTKANEYHAVPPPITGNPLTPRADISFAGLDEYAFRNKIIESKTTETNKTVGNTNEATIVKPKFVNETIVSKSKINRDEVMIEDWTSDDEDDVCVVKTVSFVKPNVTQAVRSQADKSGQTSQKQGIGFKKIHKLKACFVCKSTDHLIKDCDFYKSLEPRVKNVVNTRERVVKPVWDYGKRVNHQNFSKKLKYPHAKRTFNPSAVLTRAGLVNTDRSNVSTARSISTVRPVSTARPLASKIAQSNSVIRPNHPRLDIVRPKASNSPIKRSYFTQPVYRPKDLKPDVKTFRVKNMTTVGTRAVVSKGKVENVLKK